MSTALSPLAHDLAALHRAGATGREKVRLARGVDPGFEPPAFMLYSHDMAASLRDPTDLPDGADAGQGMGSLTLTGTTSSTDVDLYRTRMSQQALAAMLKGALGLTTFLNHEYGIPENVLGTIILANSARRRGQDGVLYTDLDITTSVDRGNPRAVRCWEQVRGGTRLGFSIGAYILAWEWQLPDGARLEVDYDDPWAPYFPPTEDALLTFLDVLLLESSLVGIPANRRSWVTNAAGAVIGRGMAHLSDQRKALADTHKVLAARGSRGRTPTRDERRSAEVDRLARGLLGRRPYASLTASERDLLAVQVADLLKPVHERGAA